MAQIRGKFNLKVQKQWFKGICFISSMGSFLSGFSDKKELILT